MSYMGGNHRARVDRNHPEAFGICDRCGFLHNLKDLEFQMQWRGNQLQSTGWRVCRPCMDKPFELDRPLKLTTDPEPVKDARPPNWASQEGPPPANVPVQQLIEDD